jgi:hypothetical protein
MIISDTSQGRMTAMESTWSMSSRGSRVASGRNKTLQTIVIIGVDTQEVSNGLRPRKKTHSSFRQQ